jgi:hypothetical protein
MRRDHFTISGSTTTGTTDAEILGSPLRGLHKYDRIEVDASIAGVELGTLDVYLQRRIAYTSQVSGGVWADWVHFPQAAEGAARAYYAIGQDASTGIKVVGRGTDSSPGTPALAANTALGGHPGSEVRMVTKCGSATMTGTSVTITFNCTEKWP